MVRKVAERQVRGVVQGIYQAAAQSYWLSPQIAGQVPRTKDELSLSYLLGLAEQMHLEVGSLAGVKGEVPTLSINAQIELAGPDERAAFLDEVRTELTRIAEKYGGEPREAEPELFRLVLATYPIPDEQEE